MEGTLTETKIMQALDWAYDKAINGFAGLDSAQELAESYIKEGESLVDSANSLIRWQNTKAATSGFLAGLGGILVMPLTLPANITSVLYVQIRMIAAIAIVGGYDVRDDRVKALVYACLAGEAVKESLKGVGIAIGSKVAINAVKGISGKTITAINKAVGFKLLTKFGETGIVNLGKAIPVVGGVVGGSFDLYMTNSVGNIARDTFIANTGEKDASSSSEITPLRHSAEDRLRDLEKLKVAALISEAEYDKLRSKILDSV
jgi:uncharacterized protein (DUF697 family)